MWPPHGSRPKVAEAYLEVSEHKLWRGQVPARFRLEFWTQKILVTPNGPRRTAFHRHVWVLLSLQPVALFQSLWKTHWTYIVSMYLCLDQNSKILKIHIFIITFKKLMKVKIIFFWQSVFSWFCFKKNSGCGRKRISQLMQKVALTIFLLPCRRQISLQQNIFSKQDTPRLPGRLGCWPMRGLWLVIWFEGQCHWPMSLAMRGLEKEYAWRDI